jgi:hypothetical protein
VERTALTAVVDRASLVASSRAFAEASRGVASLPPSFEFSSMRALGHARMAERHSDIEGRASVRRPRRPSGACCVNKRFSPVARFQHLIASPFN